MAGGVRQVATRSRSVGDAVALPARAAGGLGSDAEQVLAMCCRETTFSR